MCWAFTGGGASVEVSHGWCVQIPLQLVQWAAMYETPDSLEIEEGDDITECSPMTRGMWTQMANLTVKSIQTT